MAPRPYAVSMTDHDRLLIVDFGSQVTQLIARRLREAGVYCEIHPFNTVTDAFLKAFSPKAVILSGGPASVTDPDSPERLKRSGRWVCRCWASVTASRS